MNGKGTKAEWLNCQTLLPIPRIGTVCAHDRRPRNDKPLTEMATPTPTPLTLVYQCA